MSVFELPKRPETADLYDQDFYSWALQQATLMREGRFDEVDLANIVEELESLGKEQFHKLSSALRVLMIHMLKWAYQPDRRGRSWLTAIIVQRGDFADVLAENPGLKPRVAEAVERAYRRARFEAAAETGLKTGVFPAECPYTMQDLTARPFDLDPA